MDTGQLWGMQPDAFNEWRIVNDLPRLLVFLKENIPLFPTWMQTFGISDEDFISAPHTGLWFLGEAKLEFVEYEDESTRKYAICDSFNDAFSFLSQHRRIKKGRTIEFDPFLSWGKRISGRQKFILQDPLNKQYSSTLEYRAWSGTRPSQAFLLYRHPVLKLGQFDLLDGVVVGSRNLDFVDLDGLNVCGDSYGSHAIKINFSSCREFTIAQGSMHHVSFSHSFVEDFRCVRGSMQDFIFESCDLRNFSLSESVVNGLTISDSRFSSPMFERTEVQRFVYKPQTMHPRYQVEADNCRRLRSFFQGIGQRAEAELYYYLERNFERKSLWSPYLNDRSRFPNRAYAGRLRDLVAAWKDEYWSNKEATQHALSILKFHFQVWATPKYSIRALGYKFRYLGSLLQYHVWGYGVKPVRVVAFAIMVIMSFAGAYYLLGPTEQNMVDSLYFSSVTFSTLGYGDIKPNNSAVKILCGVEALLGAVTMGLIIGVFANRSKY